MKKALITGINGQDGSYLAEFLINKGYEVWGILKRNSVTENQTARLDNVYNKIKKIPTPKNYSVQSPLVSNQANDSGQKGRASN